MGKIGKRIFVIGSILFLSFMVCFYGYRLFYYYSAEHKKEISVTLTNEIITNSEKLKELNGKFYFYGEIENNYLYYSGILYRIISFNDDYLTIVSNEDLTKLKYGMNGDYSSSDVKTWLEEEYLKNVNTNLLYKQEVSLLDLDDYKEIGSNHSFIKSSDMWILDDGKGLMLDKEGNVNNPDNYQYFLRIRPVVKVKNIDYLRGDGTVNNPYLVENRFATTLENTYVGEYIIYKDNSYRIISKENGIKVVSNNSVGKYKFSNSTNLFQKDSTLYQYLNGQFLTSFNQDDLLVTEWNLGTYQASYQDTKSSTVSSYVGLLTVGDYFIQDVSGYLLSSSENMVYTINEEENLYLVPPSRELEVYPSVSLKKELSIVGGLGTKENPYEVGEV